MNKNLITLALGLSLTACGGDPVETTPIEEFPLESMTQIVNTPASFSGDQTGSLLKDATAPAMGTVMVIDPDDGESMMMAEEQTGSYGALSIDATGAWTYTLDTANTAIMALVGGASVTDTFLISSADKTPSSVSITISGAHTEAVVSGDTTATTKTSDSSATGNLVVTDPDVNEAVFQIQEDVETTFGTFSLDAMGAWQYSIDKDNIAVSNLSLTPDETLIDTVPVATADGTASTVVITITFGNAGPQFIGDSTGSSTNVTTALVTGTLTVKDPDNGQSSMNVQTDEPTSYGSFSIDEDGVWEYTLDNNNSDVKALGRTKDKLADAIDVVSFDGSTKRITVTITGTIDGDLDDDIASNEGSISGEIEVDGYEAADVKAVIATDQVTDMAYGTYSMTDLGVWTYTLNSPLDAAVAALVDDGTLMDSFTITAADGNSTTLDITIGAAKDLGPVSVPDPLDEFEFTAGSLDNSGTEKDIRETLSISGSANLTLTNVAGAAGDDATAINLDKGATNGGYFKYSGAEDSGLDQVTGSFTTEVVLNMASHNTSNDVSIFEFADTNAYLGWKTYIEKDDQAIRFKIYGEGTNTEVKTSDADIYLTEGEWYHIASVYDAAGGGDNGTISIYINGELATSKEIAFLPTENVYTDQATFAGSSTSSDKNLQGVMDNVALWNEALSIEQIQTRASTFDLYDLGPVIPDPLDEFTFTAGSLENTGTEKDIRAALTISGSDNLTLTNVAGSAGEAETAINLDKGITNGGYFKYSGAEDSGLDQVTGSFTTEVVLNMASHNTSNDVSIFEYADTSSYLGWKTYIEKDDQAIRFKIYGEGTNTEVKTSDASIFLTEGEWYHIVSVYDTAGGGDNGTISIYINGALAVSKEIAFTPTENVFGDQATFAGSSTSSDKNLQGVMDNVALWNEALTAEVIEARAAQFALD